MNVHYFMKQNEKTKLLVCLKFRIHALFVIYCEFTLKTPARSALQIPG